MRPPESCEARLPSSARPAARSPCRSGARPSCRQVGGVRGARVGRADRGRWSGVRSERAAAAREMLELLARGRITTALDTAQDLVVARARLRRRIGELTHDLENAEPPTRRSADPTPPLSAGTTSRDPGPAQEAYADLLLEARERAPRHAALVSPEIAAWAEHRSPTPAPNRVHRVLASDSATLVFVVTSDTIAVNRSRHAPARARAPRRLRARTIERRGGRRHRLTVARPVETSSRGPDRSVLETGLLAGKTRLCLSTRRATVRAVRGVMDTAGHFLVER